MSDTHCDNCDRDAAHSELVPFQFMGGTGLRHKVGCVMADSIKRLAETYDLGTGARRAVEEGRTVMGAGTPKATAFTALPTTREIARVIADVEPDDDVIDDAVMGLRPDLVPVMLAGCAEIVSLVYRWKKALTIRMVADQRIGERVEVNGKSYVFEEGRSGSFDNIGGLFYILNRMGVSVTALGDSVTGVRVTDLERHIAALDEDVRTDAYDTLREHRTYKPTGAQLVDENSPYRRKTKTRRAKEEEAA